MPTWRSVCRQFRERLNDATVIHSTSELQHYMDADMDIKLQYSSKDDLVQLEKRLNLMSGELVLSGRQG